MTKLHEVGTVATSVFTDDDGYTKVVYHSTVVVKWNSDEVVLNSGGWKTVTTKVRMNQASNQFGLGFQVYQKDFEWFVVEFNLVDGGDLYDWKNPIPFEDGMSIARRWRR